MAYDFRPYIQVTKPSGGQPGRGVFIKMDDFYMYPDHGYIAVAAIPQRGLPGLQQPFADAYQGNQIINGIWRVMWKEAKRL